MPICGPGLNLELGPSEENERVDVGDDPIVAVDCCRDSCDSAAVEDDDEHNDGHLE